MDGKRWTLFVYRLPSVLPLSHESPAKRIQARRVGGNGSVRHNDAAFTAVCIKAKGGVLGISPPRGVPFLSAT